MPFSRYSTFSDGNFACFCVTFCIKKTVINRLPGSLAEVIQWHITFDLKHVALQFKNLYIGKN